MAGGTRKGRIDALCAPDRHLLHLHRFALMLVFCVTHANTSTSKGARARTHAYIHTQSRENAFDDAIMCFTLLASCQGDTPPEKIRKQTAHNIIGIGMTFMRCMTCPVTLETSLHPAAQASLNGWRLGIGRMKYGGAISGRS